MDQHEAREIVYSVADAASDYAFVLRHFDDSTADELEHFRQALLTAMKDAITKL